MSSPAAPMTCAVMQSCWAGWIPGGCRGNSVSWPSCVAQERPERLFQERLLKKGSPSNCREPRAKQQLKPEAPETKTAASRSVNKQGLSVTRDKAQLQCSSNAYILAARGEKGARHLPAAQPQAGLCEGSHVELCVDPTQSSATLRLLPPGEDAPTKNNMESCSHLAEGSRAVTLQPQGVPRAAHGTR